MTNLKNVFIFMSSVTISYIVLILILMDFFLEMTNFKAVKMCGLS